MSATNAFETNLLQRIFQNAAIANIGALDVDVE
jgi:hypothetical protein